LPCIRHIARWHNNVCAGGTEGVDGVYDNARIAAGDDRGFPRYVAAGDDFCSS
jgi:hypothetical protein